MNIATLLSQVCKRAHDMIDAYRDGRKTPEQIARGTNVALLSKPELNLLAGWLFLFDSQYRQELREEWHGEPRWVVLLQIAAGICSVVFPIAVIVLLAYVGISRYF
ncbi:MAG: hypothetical protein QNJ91_09975 [Gammaproteobacteria bacterium]|nr:hypothetical protein [Gammaproteobacteria bacterium]